MPKNLGLILNPPEEDHWLMGMVDPIINPSGDWTPYKAQNESQSTTNLDTNGCTLFGTGHALVSASNLKGYQDFPKDVSERYWGVEANTTIYGTDPHALIEAVRTSCGALPAAVLPWTDDLESYDEYYAPKPMDKSLFSVGSALLNKFEINHKWVFPPGSVWTPQQKQDLLAQALKIGPVCVSMDSSYTFVNGKLTKPVGAADGHWVQLIKEHTIFDQYAPFLIDLDPLYDHVAAKVYFLTKKAVSQRKSFWDSIWDSFTKLWAKHS